MPLITDEEISIKDIFTNFSVQKKKKNPYQNSYRSQQTTDSWKSDSSTEYDRPQILKKKTRQKLKTYYDEIMLKKRNTPFFIITWLICTYVSIITTARFKIVDRLTGLAYQLNHLDMAIMFITSQILYYGLVMGKGRLAVPWLITMFWALLTTEGPCIVEASQKFLGSSLIGQSTFVGLIIIFFLKLILWIEVLLFTNSPCDATQIQSKEK